MEGVKDKFSTIPKNELNKLEGAALVIINESRLKCKNDKCIEDTAINQFDMLVKNSSKKNSYVYVYVLHIKVKKRTLKHSKYRFH